MSGPLTPRQIKEAADLAKRLGDLRDDVPWPFVGGCIDEFNTVIGHLEYMASDPEPEED